MSFICSSRRGFLRVSCILDGGLLLGVRLNSKAYAAAKGIKDYMTDRINSVYGQDSQFPHRAAQDNEQVRSCMTAGLAVRWVKSQKS